MAWPEWIEELKRRYLADEGNVFVLHGAVNGTTFRVDGEDLDCVGVLRRFLTRSRPIVGVFRPWPHPSRLEFAGLHDRNRFENLVKAHDLLEGHTDALRETHPPEALARIWRALSTAGTDQAYIILDTQRLLPSHRTSVTPLPGAPSLPDWPEHGGLRQSNNILLFLAESRALVRPGFLDRVIQIEVAEPVVLEVLEPDDPVPATPEEPAPAEEPLPHAPPEAAPPTPSPPTPPAVADLDGPDVDDVRRDLEPALLRTVLAHPTSHRPARLPVMDAVAQVIAHHRPSVWGTLSIDLDDEGEVRVRGPGASRFLETWRSDIALDAAAGMLLKQLDGSYTDQAPPPLDPTAVTALCKRIVRAIDRL